MYEIPFYKYLTSSETDGLPMPESIKLTGDIYRDSKIIVSYNSTKAEHYTKIYSSIVNGSDVEIITHQSIIESKYYNSSKSCSPDQEVPVKTSYAQNCLWYFPFLMRHFTHGNLLPATW